jgi:hypothetical protein
LTTKGITNPPPNPVANTENDGNRSENNKRIVKIQLPIKALKFLVLT